MNKKLREALERNITHEQKVRFSLWQINKNIIYGFNFVCAFILILVCVTTKSLLFGVISVLGMWAMLIALITCFIKDKKIEKDILDYYENENLNKYQEVIKCKKEK